MHERRLVEAVILRQPDLDRVSAVRLARVIGFLASSAPGTGEGRAAEQMLETLAPAMECSEAVGFAIRARCSVDPTRFEQAWDDLFGDIVMARHYSGLGHLTPEMTATLRKLYRRSGADFMAMIERSA